MQLICLRIKCIYKAVRKNTIPKGEKRRNEAVLKLEDPELKDQKEEKKEEDRI